PPHPAPDVTGEGREVRGPVRRAQVGRSGRRRAWANVVDQDGPAGGALGPPELEAGLRRGGREEDGVAERPQVGRVREDGTARAWHDRRRAIAGPVAAPEPQAEAVAGAEEETLPGPDEPGEPRARRAWGHSLHRPRRLP